MGLGAPLRLARFSWSTNGEFGRDEDLPRWAAYAMSALLNCRDIRLSARDVVPDRAERRGLGDADEGGVSC